MLEITRNGSAEYAAQSLMLLGGSEDSSEILAALDAAANAVVAAPAAVPAATPVVPLTPVTWAV